MFTGHWCHIPMKMVELKVMRETGQQSPQYSQAHLLQEKSLESSYFHTLCPCLLCHEKRREGKGRGEEKSGGEGRGEGDKKRKKLISTLSKKSLLNFKIQLHSEPSFFTYSHMYLSLQGQFPTCLPESYVSNCPYHLLTKGILFISAGKKTSFKSRDVAFKNNNSLGEE